MGTEPWAVASVVLASVLAAGASFLLKRGAVETQLSLRHFHVSSLVIGAVFLNVLSILFFLVALLGAQLSLVLPFTTLEYVWIAVLAKKFLHEEISRAKVLGMASIVLGVILVGLGS